MVLIAIDLDGVLIHTIRAWLKKYHPNYGISDLNSYYVWKHIEGCTEKQFYMELSQLTSEDVEIDERGKEIIDLLRKDGHVIFFLTSKRAHSMEWTCKVLAREGFIDIPLINSHIACKSKDEYEYDVLIDDSPGNVYARTWTFDQPWNGRHCVNKRIYSFAHIYDEIDKL